MPGPGFVTAHVCDEEREFPNVRQHAPDSQGNCVKKPGFKASCLLKAPHPLLQYFTQQSYS